MILAKANQGPISVEDVWREFVSEKLWALDPAKAERRSREQARVHLAGLERAGRLVHLGDVQLNEWGGRARKMYAAPSLKVNRGWLTHDAMLWVWLRRLTNARIVAGFDPGLAHNEDAKVTFTNGRVGHAEMDTELESLAVVMEKFDGNYKGRVRLADPAKGEHQAEFVLFVTLSQERIDKLKARLRTHEAGRYTLFAVWYDLVRGEDGKPWEDVNGVRHRLYPRGG